MATRSDAEIPGRAPALGRVLAGAVLALFLMVGMGLYWVWSRAQREREWRNAVTLESGGVAGQAGSGPVPSSVSEPAGSPD
ncbi:MAG: hypothetical protein KF833_13715 [Verrucomicrobiae bacterium]|nr:hypothetical protein [Verrucomicrobiae bacterium]